MLLGSNIFSFRYWITDAVVKRKMTAEQLANLPPAKYLRGTILKEMIPEGMVSSEIGSWIPLKPAIYHTGVRLMKR